ncbi:T9SS type A sorting domain-containing protein [Rhodohalobacter sp. SW132]|uniref:T9SS type A sorting domain-containing protein n=1 Tax=Rhodohalobacter sp. SW132 TaxID=2293433 RepID=UPI0013156563|nr:T9SS type A sorting domain-containing protein [Rhodohalobacter sp. SW132]
MSIKIEKIFFRLLLLAATFLGALSLQAQHTTYWNGSVSSNWFDSQNWSNDVPGADSEAVFNYFPPENHDPIISSSTTIRRLLITHFGREFRVKLGDDIQMDVQSYFVAADSIPGTIALDVGNAEFTVQESSSLEGGIYLDDGTINFLGNLHMISSSLIDVQSGTINIGSAGPPVISADFLQSEGSIFNLNAGTLNLYGQSVFAGGGEFNGGTGEIHFNGDIQFNGGALFKPGSSYVSISGNANITTDNNQSAEFFDLEIRDGAAVTSEVNVTVQNDMTVDPNGSYLQSGNTSLNVIGTLTGDSQIHSVTPYVISVQMLGISEIEVRFDRSLQESTAETSSNYTVESSAGTIAGFVTGAELTGSNNHLVRLTFDFQIQDGVPYYLIINEVFDTMGNSISENHKKRFLLDLSAPSLFYSRTNGNFNTLSSWSIFSHSGSAAGRIPGEADGDRIQIGNGNIITLNSPADLDSIMEFDVQFGGTFRLSDGAELRFSSVPITGNGAFELLQGATLIIESDDGISQSDDLGPVRTAERIFSEEAAFFYQGFQNQVTGDGLPQKVAKLSIKSSAEVSLTRSISVTDTLYLIDGYLTVGHGLSLISNQHIAELGMLRYNLDLSGQPGYRMISSPLNIDYTNFFSDIITQGYNGSELIGNLQPNVLWYDETAPGTDNQRWRAPVHASEIVPAGRGHQVYIFDNESDNHLYSRALPQTLDLVGLPYEEDKGLIDLNLTYTEEGDQGWNLVGNPYGSAIRWNSDQGWTRGNVDSSIYIWDPNTNQYHTWNGITGDIEDGLIAPFQAFWVKANAPGPLLTVNSAAQELGGEFRGKAIVQHSPRLAIRAQYSPNHSSTLHLMFTGEGSFHLDNLDALRLHPPPGVDNYLEFYSVSEEGERLAINNLPRKFGRAIEIPLELNAYKNGIPLNGDIILETDLLENVPESWDIYLIHEKSGEIYSLNTETSEYILSAHLQPTVELSDQAHKKSPQKIVTKSDGGHTSFLLRIEPGRDADGIPDRFSLQQNYPNPFNPSTTFRFELPIQSQIRFEVFDLLGRRVSLLADDVLSAGVHEIRWDASNLASGIYISRLVTPKGVHTRKLTLMK